MRHARLITVLTFAVLIIILAYLVASVTSCTTPDATVQPTIVKPTEIIAPNGTVYHPYTVDADSVAPGLTWKVQTATGRELWKLNQLHTFKADDFIVYKDARYHISAINRSALTMTVSGPLDCCAASK